MIEDQLYTAARIGIRVFIGLVVFTTIWVALKFMKTGERVEVQ